MRRVFYQLSGQCLLTHLEVWHSLLSSSVHEKRKEKIRIRPFLIDRKPKMKKQKKILVGNIFCYDPYGQ